MIMARGGCANAYFRPQFVAKLQPDDLHKLEIPSEFMMHMENEDKNCSVASVFSPLRKFWFIKLIKDNSRTYFKDGWCEFSKFHKLEVGFTLVFRYEGNMVLKVKVFGLNGCLKDYKEATVALLRRTGFNALRENSAEKRTNVTEGPSCSRKQKKRKHDMSMGGTLHKERSNVQDELRMASNSYVKKKNVISTSHETHETIMSHYNIHNFLPLPKKFGSVSPYILEKGEVTVKNEKQETWKVQFNTPASYNNLCRGWKEFCWQNRIKCGDTCLLKIIAKNEILVAISKAAKSVEAVVVE